MERPAQVFFHGTDAQVDDKAYAGISFGRLPDEEHEALRTVTEHLVRSPRTPTFLIMGRIFGEETRRSLRQRSLEAPLFFLEINNAPNHLSLAREAKLTQRVIRILTPAIFDERLHGLSTVFLAGNADILNIFESMHFQLKGTPSASEIELLSFLRENNEMSGKIVQKNTIVEPSYRPLSVVARPPDAFAWSARLLDERLGKHVEKVADGLERRMDWVTEKLDLMSSKVEGFRSVSPMDPFARMDARALLDDLVREIDSSPWQEQLQQSLLQVFVKHHQEYRLDRCVVVSGSSRTALGLLGFHCGIRDVVIADLSWSYEHCFPSVQAVPLTGDLGLGVEGIIEAVRGRIVSNEHWREGGAVVINNPHNATGRVFDEAGIEKLILWLLEHDVWVIDDLSYQEVAPSLSLPAINSVRQLADRMVRKGRLSEERASRVITVHSVSKTDCLAGARLAVVELRHEGLFRRFVAAHRHIRPNLGAIALTYLFYRNEIETARAYWRLRNQILLERSRSLVDAQASLPHDRNPFDIEIIPPTGSLYPLMIIHQLPSGLSLDWLASGLARQGIGMLPLSTFARTEQGFETGRKTFRLTLGGVDNAEVLLKKTRRVLIDLNRLIGEESSRYNRLYPHRSSGRVGQTEEGDTLSRERSAGRA